MVLGGHKKRPEDHLIGRVTQARGIWVVECSREGGKWESIAHKQIRVRMLCMRGLSHIKCTSYNPVGVPPARASLGSCLVWVKRKTHLSHMSTSSFRRCGLSWAAAS